jgi:hypothetical protein
VFYFGVVSKKREVDEGTKLSPFVAAYTAKTATTVLGYNYATDNIVFECSAHCHFYVFGYTSLLFRYKETFPEVRLNKHVA